MRNFSLYVALYHAYKFLTGCEVKMPRDKASQLYVPWPQRHGFCIGGHGPAYVLHVTRGSAADKQGLRRGDQILELDNHKVSQMSAHALENFAKHLNTNVPTIKVVNDVQHVELYATRLYRFGFTLQYSQKHGFLIDSIQSRGPAYKAGLRKGEANLHVINLCGSIRHLIFAGCDKFSVLQIRDLKFRLFGAGSYTSM